MSPPSNGTCEAQFKPGRGNRNVAERRAAQIVPKNLDETSILGKREVHRDVGWRWAGRHSSWSTAALNLKRLGFFAFRDCAKWLTPRMWLNTQFFVMEVAREPFENMNEW